MTENPGKLPKTIQTYLDQFRRKYNFDPKVWIHKRATKLNTYMLYHGLKSCVVSVSGGVDSAVTYMLALKAMSMTGSPIKQVLGLSQPIHSTSSICNRAHLLPGKIVTIDQTKIFDDLESLVTTQTGLSGTQFSNGQLKSYMRTPVNYYVAQLLTAKGEPSIVLGTGNMDEDQYLAYFCKAGDGVVDVQLIADLHKSQVFQVGAELGVPKEILEAPPTADLWEDQTDEDELGFPYDFIEFFTELSKQNIFDQTTITMSLPDDEYEYYEMNKKKAEKIHKQNSHKLNFPLNLC